MSDTSARESVHTELADTVSRSWKSFLEVYEPLRPELYRFCRYLSRSAWDAEDLVQDTLGRAFATLGGLHEPPHNPRAWLFRVASNRWIDQVRRHGARPTVEAAAGPDRAAVAPTGVTDRDTREAAGTLLVQLSPQERAAVVLKDVFELTLEEVAAALSTSAGSVKAALHRGRGKLTERGLESEDGWGGAAGAGSGAGAAVIDAFCDAFNARDLPRLTALLLDTSVVELVGVVTEYGPEASSHPKTGSLPGFFSPITSSESGDGIDPRHLTGYLGQEPRVEVRDYRGEPILLYWYAHSDGEAVRTVARVASDGDHLASMHNYFFTPDVIADVCRELDVPFRTNGYRYW
jgi:RNA polymerase sigma-70 factor (ECF subfamily)